MRGSKEGIREIQSPLGDGNSIANTVCSTVFIREIQSPLGDGNISDGIPYVVTEKLEKYSPR